ncbi:serine protease Do-like HtrA [Triticum dicoccoides]|uniref:serine protease Do-like HtrA n=1 Tax=Triticum dicoccoides TaxID=85692 RepID=UPI00188F5EF9|nr:serine protease Do-like HtrA [Triticum dicoccoides]
MAAETRSSELRSKTTRGDDHVEEDEEGREPKKMKTTLATEQEEDGDGDKELEISSPLREPYVPDGIKDRRANQHIFTAYKLAKAKFSEKRDRVNKMLPTCQYFQTPLVSVPDAGRKAVLPAARSLIRLSSSLGRQPLARSAGLWIDWDEGSGAGIVLTSAHLIRAKEPLPKDYRMLKDRHLYHPGAQVTVHLLDDTTTEGRLLYHQEHYDVAFFKVAVDRRVQLTSFVDTVNIGQKALRLGREENLNLRITHGKVKLDEAELGERHHHNMYFYPDEKYECDDDGEPVIDFDGKVVGIINCSESGSFVPSSILNNCMYLWRNFGCIPRPHLGLQCEALKFLDPIHAEYIWRKLNIDDGLVVKEVSIGSQAEKVGIRVGDIIECIDGERISTTIELENKLLSICMGTFDRGNDINAKVDVSVRVFHTANHVWRTKQLTVNISDRREVVEGGQSVLFYAMASMFDFPVSTWHCFGLSQKSGRVNVSYPPVHNIPERLTLDTTYGVPRCDVNKSSKCLLMRKELLVEARRAVLAVQTNI